MPEWWRRWRKRSRTLDSVRYSWDNLEGERPSTITHSLSAVRGLEGRLWCADDEVLGLESHIVTIKERATASPTL